MKQEKKLYSITEAKEMFSIKKGLGVNLTKVLMQLNNMVYNSNLKLDTFPGDFRFIGELESELVSKIPGHSFISSLKSVQHLYETGDERMLGMFIKLASGNSNNHRIKNLDVSTICKVLSEAYDKGLSDKDIVLIPFKYHFRGKGSTPYKVEDVVDACWSVKDKTLDNYTQLGLALNELNTEESIIYKMRSLNILDKPVKEKPVVIDKSEPDTKDVSTANIGVMNVTNNPLLIARWLMYQITNEDLKKSVAIKILTDISETNPNFRSDEFSEIVFGEVMILIPLKEYIQLLKSAK